MATISSINWISITSVSSFDWIAKASISNIDWINIPSALTYATRNPSDKNANITLSSGNLVATASNTAWKSVRATIWKSSGKWYWEVVTTKSGTWNAMIWVARSSSSLSTYAGSTATDWSYYSYNGKLDAKNAFNNNVNITYGTAFATGNVIGIALNMDAGELTFYKNNVTQGTFTGLSGTMYPMVSPYDNTLYFTANFGATTMVYTAPTWFNQGLYS